MTYLCRILRLTALVVWIGGIVFFAFAVTIVAFHQLPDAHQAGIVVRGTLLELHKLGMIAGAIYLIATLTLIGTSRDSHILRAVEVLLILVMLGLTGYSQFSVIPRMESDRLAVGGDITKAPDSAQTQHFNRLHKVSERVESIILGCGVLLILLASIHQREHQGID